MSGGNNEWLGLVINLICAWIAMDYMDRSFTPKHTGNRRFFLYICGIAIYFFVVTAFDLLVGFEGIMGLAYGLVLFVYGLTALKGRRQDMVFMSMVWVLVAFISYYITASVIRIATGCSLEELNHVGLTAYHYSLAATMLRLVLAKLTVAAKKTVTGSSGIEELILAGASFALFLVVNGIVMLDMGNLSQSGKNRLSIGMFFGFFGIILSLIYFYYRLNIKNKEKIAVEYDKQQFQQQREHLEQLNLVCAELGRFRHDLSSMLDTVSGLIQKGKQEEALLCLDRMDHRLRNCPAPAKSTGNEGLDMALLRTNQSCREHGIDFRYVVSGNVSRFDAMNMGILFYNLLKNAVDSCRSMESSESPEIFLQIWEKSNGIHCRLENSIRESVLEANPLLHSRKAGKMCHGFGLKSIRQIVEDYGGSYSFSEEDGMFVQEIWIQTKVTG